MDRRPGGVREITTVELACVWKIAPDGVHVFAALDGHHQVVKTYSALEADLDEYLDKDQDFADFKLQAVVGGDTERYRLSLHEDLVPVCLGQTSDTPMKLIPTPGRKETIQPRQTVGATDAPDTSKREALDQNKEIRDLTGAIMTGREGEETTTTGEDAEPLGPQTGNGLMPYAVLGFALIFVYNYVQ